MSSPTEITPLRATRERYRQLVEAVPVGILVHQRGKIIFANPEAAAVVGAEDAGELVGRDILDFAHPEERENVVRRVERVIEERSEAEPMEIRARRLDGGTLHVEIRGIPISYGGEDAVLTLVRDVTERVQAQQALAESEERYRRLFEEVRDAVYVSDPDGRILDVNPAAEDLLGYSREELLELDARELYADPEQRTRWKEALEEQGTLENFELRLRRKDGREIICMETATVRTGPDGEPLGYQGIIRDITERRQFEEELEHRALHDPLTDLPNRTLFWDRLEHALVRSDRRGHALAVVFADLDDFKVVNDSLGHGAGDDVLVQVASRLRSCFRSEDTVARVGGDEFTVLLETLESTDQASEGAERLLWLLREPFEIQDRTFQVGASIGISIYRPGAGFGARSPREIADELVRLADRAMYRAKEAGGDRYIVGTRERAEEAC